MPSLSQNYPSNPYSSALTLQIFSLCIFVFCLSPVMSTELSENAGQRSGVEFILL